MNGHKRINSSLSSALTTPNAPTSLTAQESREKRLAHQQSRYRDRGGVFVPQQRTALLDILLGKTTLKRVTRSRSRSVSCSPVRRKSEKLAGGNHDQAPPKGKKGRKSVIQDTGDQDEQNAGPSIIKKSAPLRKGGRKSSSRPARTRKSTTMKPAPNPTASSDEFFAKSGAALSNARSSRKSEVAAAEVSDADNEDIAKPRGTTLKSKAASSKAKGKRKAVQDDTDEEEVVVQGKKVVATKSRTSDVQAKEKPQPKSKTKQTKASTSKVKPIDLTSDNEQDQGETHDASDFPSSPLARRSKRRAVGKSKDEAGDIDNGATRKKTSTAKAKASTSKNSKKPAKKKQSDPSEAAAGSTTTKSRRGARAVLTPVPEESEPDSEMEREEEIIAQSAQDLAAAISVAIEDFAPVSRDKRDTAVGGGGKGRAVAKKGKGRAARKDKNDRADPAGVDEGPSSAREVRKASVKSKVKGSAATGDPEQEAKTISKPPRKKGKDDENAEEEVQGEKKSSTRSLKRTRTVAEPESHQDAESSRTRKKAKVVADVDAPVSQRSLPMKGTKSKRSQARLDEADSQGEGEGGGAAIRVSPRKSKRDLIAGKGNDQASGSAPKPEPKQTKKESAASRKTNSTPAGQKRKRAAAAESRDEADEASPEPKPKKVKKNPEALPKTSRETREVDSSLPKKRLRTASRKQKENNTSRSEEASETAVPKPARKKATASKRSAKTPSSTTSKAKPKKGPPQSVLDRIKRSASSSATNGSLVGDDEPDELDFLS